jgi:hypothetical protein
MVIFAPQTPLGSPVHESGLPLLPQSPDLPGYGAAKTAPARVYYTLRRTDSIPGTSETVSGCDDHLHRGG